MALSASLRWAGALAFCLGGLACNEDDARGGLATADTSGAADVEVPGSDVPANEEVGAPDATEDDVPVPEDIGQDVPPAPPVGTWTANPLGLGEDFVLKGVWAASPDALVAVGNKATVIEKVNGAWQLVHQNLELDTLNAVWGAALDDVWAVGAYGAIVHRSAKGWTVGAGCSSDAACDDGNVCTVDSCGVDGKCLYDPSGAAGCCGTEAYAEGFEAGLANWTVVDLRNTGVVWHTSTYRAAEGKSALYFGVPDRACPDNPAELCPNFDAPGFIVSASATSGPVTLPDAASVTARFSVFLEAESSASWDRLELRVHQGATVTTVWTKEDVGGVTNELFVETSADLTPFAGSEVQFEWWFDSVDSGANQYEGAYVDDFRVDSTCGADLGTRFPSLFGVYGFAPDNVYAVGNQGVILHYDGAAWKRQTGGDAADLYAITGSDDQLLAGGAKGEVLSTLGGGGLTTDRATFTTVRGAALLDDGRAVLAGDGGVVSVATNGAWSDLSTGVTANLNEVVSLGGSSALLVGAEGTILRMDGSTFTPEASGTTRTLYGAWVQGAESLVVGEKGTLLVKVAGVWEDQSLTGLGSGADSELRDVIAFPTGLALAVGGGGTIAERIDGVWKKVKGPTTYVLHGLWAANADDVWAVGNAGALLHRKAGAWAAAEAPTSESLYEVWGRSPDEVYAVGAKGVLARWDGVSWRLLRSATSVALRSVWGPDPGEVFAVGDGPTAMRFDGLLWSAVPIADNVVDGLPQPVTGTLYDVAGGAGEVYAAGQDGLLLKLVREGELRFEQVQLGELPTLRGLAVSADGAVLAVGREGSVTVVDPAWGVITEPTGSIAQLYDVVLFGDGRAVAVGDLGTVLERSPP